MSPVPRVDIDFSKTEKKKNVKKNPRLGPAVEQRKMSIDSQSEAKWIDWHIIYLQIFKPFQTTKCTDTLSETSYRNPLGTFLNGQESSAKQENIARVTMFNSERKARKKESGIIPTASCCLTHYPSARACQNPDIEWVDDSHLRQGPGGNYPSQFEQTLNLILIHDARIGGSSPTRPRRMLFERHVLATPTSPTAESFEGDPSLKWQQNHKNDGSHFS